MNHKVFFNMTEDYSEGYFILLYSVARLSLILFSPQRWHIALSKSESLPAQRDGKFTVGLTQILLTGVFGIFNSDRDPFVVVTFKGCKKFIQLNLCYCEEKKKNPYFENLGFFFYASVNISTFLLCCGCSCWHGRSPLWHDETEAIIPKSALLI